MASKQKKQAKKTYDYSGLEKGMRVQAESDGRYYAADVVVVSTSKSRVKAPVKVSYTGWEGYDEWLGGDRLRSKVMKVVVPERPIAALQSEGEIPIGRVARVYRAKVKGEAEALKLDALVNEAHAKFVANRKDKTKGYVKMTRQVCKTEWAYELSVVWRSFDDFTAYKESDFRKEVNGLLESRMKELITGDLYSGVRVWDELGGGRWRDVQLKAEGEIPIGSVSRVYRAKVKGEAEALKLDALVNEAHAKFVANKKEKTKGYIKMMRTVCKTEWAYELHVVWRTFDDFTAYKESDFRKEINGLLEDKMKESITGDLYSGVRVHDELSGGRVEKEVPEKQGRPARQLKAEGEIPIGRVARVYRVKVKGEAEALKLDALVNEAHAKFVANKKEKTKGYIKMTRTVCKTEWAYELSVVWRTFDDFTAYKQSDFRKEINGLLESKMKELIVGDLYSGVRVHDEL